MATIFPFSAIVGQDRMKRALVLNAIYPQIGGVLIRGERGTAKSTAARALAAILPEIDVFEGDAYSADPARPGTWTEDLQQRHARGEIFRVVKRRTRFVNLPVSATEDRVVGTLDIEKAIQRGEKHFEPGVLAAANRGVLYVDEVNLLDDHVVDLLLDVAAMGVNVVEREGISFTHPARFVLIGSMNPEEGDLRPQLLDRFALCVDVAGVKDAKSRMQILERNLAYEADSTAFAEEWQPFETELTNEIAAPLIRVGQQRHDRALGRHHALGHGHAPRRVDGEHDQVRRAPHAKFFAQIGFAHEKSHRLFFGSSAALRRLFHFRTAALLMHRCRAQCGVEGQIRRVTAHRQRFDIPTALALGLRRAALAGAGTRHFVQRRIQFARVEFLTDLRLLSTLKVLRALWGRRG